MGLKISPSASVSLRPEAKLTASLTNVATGAVLSITAGKGALFPTYGGGDFSYLTLYDAAGNVEVIKVTARSTDTLTIDAAGRGLDNTNARAWNIGDGVRLGLPPITLLELARNPVWCGTAGGSADAITLTTAFPATAYAAGLPIEFIVASANTGAVTVNVNALGAKSLVLSDLSALTAGMLSVGMIVRAVYDGTRFIVASIGRIPIAALSVLTPAADRLPYYTSATAAALATLTSFARTLLDDADAATARTTLGDAAAWRTHIGAQLSDGSTNLRGNVATAGTTQATYSADRVILRNSTGDTIQFVTTGNITVDAATSGPAANGRDQAGAFTADTFVHFYWISNGTLIRLIASQNYSVNGPAGFPSGYTYWSYVGCAYFNVSSQFDPVHQRGMWITGALAAVFLNGTNVSSQQSITTPAGSAPTNALEIKGVINATCSGVTGAGSDVFRLDSVSGTSSGNLGSFVMENDIGTQNFANSTVIVPYLATYYYRIIRASTGGSGFAMNFSCNGFSVPNGST